MAILNKKIKASTIIEVLLASIIIIMSFSFGTVIILNLQKSNLSYQKVKARILISNEIAAIENSLIKTNEKIDSKEIWLEKEIVKNTSFSYIEITAYNKSGKTLASQHKIITDEN